MKQYASSLLYSTCSGSYGIIQRTFQRSSSEFMVTHISVITLKLVSYNKLYVQN